MLGGWRIDGTQPNRLRLRGIIRTARFPLVALAQSGGHQLREVAQGLDVAAAEADLSLQKGKSHREVMHGWRLLPL